jgi:hypothetical protein
MKIHLQKTTPIYWWLLVLFMVQFGWAQPKLYYHSFGTTTISGKPYSVSPSILHPHLSTSSSSWTTSASGFVNTTGRSGEALSLSDSSGTPTYTLTFTVPTGYKLLISQFDFWRESSDTGAQNWSLSINNINVGSGIIPSTGAFIGATNVANPVTEITGTVTVVLSLSGATGSGSFKLDDFTLIGTVESTASIASIPYTQDFNSLSISSYFHTGGIFSSGWSFYEVGSGADFTYRAGTGSSSTYDTYSFGAPGINSNDERAFGMLSSSSITTILGFKFTNNTGSTINSIYIGYTGEVWRQSTTADTFAFSYQSGDVPINASSGWTAVNALSFTTPTTGSAANVDGNASANRTVISPVLISGLSIPNGATYTLRWVDATSGSYAGMAIDDFSIRTLTSSTWNGTAWSNGTPTSATNVLIDGNFTTAENFTCNELTINSGKTLTVSAGHTLSVGGNIANNGSIVFKSDATGSGLFGPFTAAVTGSGNVTVERYIPANKRSFRFLTSAVTTTTSIKENWQENVSNSTTVYANNQNPNSGYGTHITGTGGDANGFDATTTNIPSMYTYTNGAWATVQNTNTNTFTAGTPYRLMVRGDRSIDMSTNTPTPTNTTLRATGALHTGDFSPALNPAASGYSFVGNPYQAPIDIKAALDASTNMDKTKVYYWDPTLNTRGGYVTRTLSSNSNNVTSSFNQYLQPGQAVFVQKTSAGSPTMTITESHKSLNNAAAGVFRTANVSDFGLLRLHLQASTNNQWNTIEGTLAVFNTTYSWNTTEEDAVKFANLDEEVSLMQDNTALAIAMQTNPSSTNELPIQLKNTRHAAYQWKFELSDYNGLTPYLVDTQNNTYTQIENNTVVPFTVNGQELNRFKIVFQSAALGTSDFDKSIIALYPNPSKAGLGFDITGVPTDATVQLYTVLGQNIPVQTITTGNRLHIKPTTEVNQGLYFVNITSEGQTSQVKWIVE